MRKIICVSLLLIFSSCSTSYKPLSWSEGFSETKLSENVFSVYFNGNEFTDKGKVADFLLLRNAELTLNNKYKYFKILNSADYSSISGGDSYLITEPSLSNTIELLKTKPKSGTVFDAEVIKKSITAKYNIKENLKDD